MRSHALVRSAFGGSSCAYEPSASRVCNPSCACVPFDPEVSARGRRGRPPPPPARGAVHAPQCSTSQDTVLALRDTGTARVLSRDYAQEYETDLVADLEASVDS